MNNQQTTDSGEELSVFDYYNQFGVVDTCEKFNISEEDLLSMIVVRYGEECNNISSHQIKSAFRNIHGN